MSVQPHNNGAGALQKNSGQDLAGTGDDQRREAARNAEDPPSLDQRGIAGVGHNGLDENQGSPADRSRQR
ncbi:hypothetical protein ACFFGH_08220 [Lysobacter korlensis]|uniref:Uncharacterized protein n=1 Tax=Lysobacter korlensis TaxID=553636 RepID=A0ABV6RLG6_9GAMM